MSETVQEYSINAAQSFIQTAVFIDDRIYQPSTVDTGEPKTIAPPTRRPKVSNTATGAKDNSTENAKDPPQEDTVSDINDIVNSFARKRIVCSMYQPTDAPIEHQMDVIAPLCTAADVVIIDWDLFGDLGDRALKLINRLIIQAIQDVPEQLRLILVYTQETDLAVVVEKITKTINSDIGDVFQPSTDQSGLTFHTKNSRVTVLGKPGSRRPDSDSDHIVEEKKLACTAVEEFAKLASGIMQAATLLSLAEIRNNSRKILSRFNHDLDAAFLTHRAFGLGTEDALSHIVPLLVSEIESVLEDALPNPLMSDDVLRDWCRNIWEPGEHLPQVYAERGLDYRQIAEDICTKGFKAASRDYNAIQNPYNSKKNAEKAGKFLLPSEDSDANLRFAHFMAGRTFYRQNQKILMLGTILHDRGQDQYLLCIQPVCDSVRLEERRTFVFVKLHKKGANGVKSVSHVIVKPDNSIVELLYKPNSYECFSKSFVPDENLKLIIAKSDDQSELYFEDICGNKYYWMGQLRTAHAQDAVGRFASNISRIGLTESEWLRLLAKK